MRGGVLVFGRRRREAEFLETIQTTFTELLADAVARLDARVLQGLEEQEQMQSVTDATVQHLRSTVVDTRNDVSRTVEQLARVCSELTDRVEAGQRVLIEAMLEVVRRSTLEPSGSTERVLGGSFPAVPAPATDDVELGASRWARSSLSPRHRDVG